MVPRSPARCGHRVRVGAESIGRGAASWKERKKLKAARTKAEKELKMLPAKIEVLESAIESFDSQLLDPELARLGEARYPGEASYGGRRTRVPLRALGRT